MFRIMEIQSEMSERALELLALPDDVPCLLLDIGCGSGEDSFIIGKKNDFIINVA